MKVLAFRCSSANSPTRLQKFSRKMPPTCRGTGRRQKHLDYSEAGYLRAVETAFKRISRGKLLGFFAAQPRALEACGGARQLTRPPTKFGGRRSPL